MVITVWGFFQVDKMPLQVPDDFDHSVCENQNLNNAF